MGEQGLALTTEASDVSGTPVPDEVLMDLAIREGGSRSGLDVSRTAHGAISVLLS